LHVSAFKQNELQKIIESVKASVFFTITQVSVEEFNQGNPSDLSVYDAIVFGINDWGEVAGNRSRKYNRLNELEAYVNNGGGIVWTHDTLEQWWDYGTQIEDPAGVDNYDISDKNKERVWYSSVKIANDHEILHSPFEIGDVGDTIDIQYTHTNGGRVKTAKAIIKSYNGKYESQATDANDFYLTINEYGKGRVAVIEIGHSTIREDKPTAINIPSEKESKILVNTLYWASSAPTPKPSPETWKTKLYQLVEKVKDAKDAALEFSKFNIDEGSRIVGDMTIDIAVDIASIGISSKIGKALKIDFDKLPKISQLTLVGIDETLKTLTADAIKSETNSNIGYALLKAAAVKGDMEDLVNFTKLSEIYELAFNRFKRTIDVTIEVWSKTEAPSLTELDFMAEQWYKVLNLYIDALKKAKTSCALYVSPGRGAGGLGQVAETKRWWNSPLKIISYDYGLIALTVLYTLLGYAGIGVTVTDLMSLGADAKIALVIWDTVNQILIENLAIAEDFQSILTFNLIRSLDFPDIYSKAPGQIEEKNFSEVSLTKSGEGTIKYEHSWPIKTKVFASAVFFNPDGGFIYWIRSDEVAVSKGNVVLNLSYPFPGLWFLLNYVGRSKMQFKAFIHCKTEDLLTKQYLIGPIEGEVPVKTITIFGVSLGSPADLHLYDSLGRHVGINYTSGDIEVEIADAYYSGPYAEPQVILIPMPSGTYHIYLKGRENESYNLTIFSTKNDTSLSRVVKTGIIAKDQELNYYFQVSSLGDIEETPWWVQHQLWMLTGAIIIAVAITTSIAFIKKRKKIKTQLHSK
jgi:hypothetical protein